MRYGDDVIEEVRSRSNIVDVVSQYVKLQRKGSSWFGLCPFHSEHTPSFSVVPDKQMYYCFGCGAAGDVFTFVMEYENYSFGEAVKFLADRAGVELPHQEYSREAREKADKRALLLRIQKEAASYYFYNLRRENGKAAYRYLRERGLGDEIIRSFGLGCSDRYGDSLYRYLKGKGYGDELLRESGLFGADEKRGMYDRFWNRVIFPIMDAKSRVIGFGGRVMGDGMPKYLNSPETAIFDKGRNLYGLHAARTARRRQLIVCEGYMDVIAMHQAGFTNAVATLGTALTAGHAGLIRRYTDEVLLLYDSDEAGVRASLRGIPILRSEGIRSRVVDLSPHKDPDEFIRAEGAEAFERRLSEAENSFLFIVRTLEAGHDLADPQGRTDFFNDVASRLLEFEDDLERNNYIDAIAVRYGVRADELKKTVSRLAMRGTPAQTYVRPRDTRTREQPRESGTEKSQKLMLTWLASWPKIFPTVERYLSPEDFTTPLYRRVAGDLYEQARRGEHNPAQILNQFEDGQEKSEVAALFNAAIPLEDDAARRKAFADTVMVMKTASLEQRIAALTPGDMRGLQDLLNQKKKLSDLRVQLQQLNISFD